MKVKEKARERRILSFGHHLNCSISNLVPKEKKETWAWRRVGKEDEKGEEPFCLLHDPYRGPFLPANNPAVPLPNQKPATWQARTQTKKTDRFWQLSSSCSKHASFLFAKKEIYKMRRKPGISTITFCQNDQDDAYKKEKPKSHINQQKQWAVQNLLWQKQTRPVSWAVNFPGDYWTCWLNEANTWNPCTNPSDISNLLCNQRPSRPIF